MLARIGVNRLVLAAVHCEIGLTVAVDVEPPHGPHARHRVFEDAGRDNAAPPLNFARLADVKGDDLHAGL